MNIGRIFANAIVRRVAYLVVAAVVAFVVSVFGSSEAFAQQTPNYLNCHDTAYDRGAWCPSGDAALTGTNARAQLVADGWNGPGKAVASLCPPTYTQGNHATYGAFRTVEVRVVREGIETCGGGFMARASRNWVIAGECPNPGETWREDLGRCFNPDECEARNGAENGMPAIQSSRPFKSLCRGGCMLTMEGNGPGSCTSIIGQSGSMMCSGVFQYSGESCPADPAENPNDPLPPESEESCTSTGPNSGVQVCKKKDGRECFESNSGAMICWGIGETGQRSTGSDAQTRGPGNTEPAPDPPTPPEEFDPAKKGDPISTQTTTDNPSGSSTTTTTTVINNSTTHGTTPPGTPGSNPGQGGGGGEDGDEDGNSASGGGSCEEPPVVDGDAALGMIARQAWETRCALEKIGEGSTVTGDVGDCDSPFTVEGDDANAQRLRAMREQICPGGPEAGSGDGNAIDWSGLDGPDSAEGTAFYGEDVVIGEDGLDTSGLGFSRSCPTIPPVNVFGQVIQFDNSVMCDWLELGGTILLILSALLSVRIMSGVGT